MKNYLSFFTIRRVIYGIIILAVLVAGYFIFFNKHRQQQTLTVHPTNFLQQVSSSGTVVAKNDLDLSFQQSGQVSGVYVNVGDSVGAGQLLASQDTAQLDAQLAQMQAGIELQQAKLDQLMAGASPEDVQTSQAAVTSAQQTVDNAYASAQATLSSVYTTMSTASNAVSYVQQTYFTGPDTESTTVQNNQAAMSVSLQDAKNYLAIAQNSTADADTDTAINHIITDLNNIYGNLTIIRQQCEAGVYYSKVLPADKASLDTQKTNINAALSTLTASQSTIASDKAALSQAQAELALTQAPPQASDIAVDQAQIAQAKASEAGVQAQIQQERIYSPISGVVTVVNAKVGSLMSPTDVAITVISAGNFEVDSYVPEINIALIKVGNPAAITLDAYGPNTIFDAMVTAVDPAQTIVDGVSTYKVTLDFTTANDPRIKSGMTGNIVITTEQKSNVISVPQGIVTITNGQSFVEVKNGKNIVETPIQTGDIASNGNIEVTSGLKDGDVVVLN